MKTRTIVIGAAVLLAGAALLWWLRAAPPPAATPQKAAPSVTVRAVAAQRGDIQSWVFADGTARSVRREYLMFQNPGRVTFIRKGLREGATVRAGEVLARQDQRQSAADVTASRAAVTDARSQQDVARAELRQAQTERELARKKFDRFESLLQKQSASRQEFDQAQAELARAEEAVSRARSRIEAAQTQIQAAQARREQTAVKFEETALVSPIDGVVAYVNINEGDYFMPSIVRTDSEQAALRTVPIVVIAPNRFEIAATVPSYERGRLQIGQRALIVPGGERAPHAPTGSNADLATAQARVYSVTPGINPGGRAIEVKLRSEDDAGVLRDGMFVTAWIATASRENTVVAPLGAFVYRDNRPLVYVIDAQRGTVDERRVELGLQSFSAQEILSGVQPGELLVTEGRFQLSDGAAVKVLGHGAGTQ